METITLPRRVVEHFLQASQELTALQDELEDYLIARQPRVLKKLRRARREHLAGHTKPFIVPPLPRAR